MSAKHTPGPWDAAGMKVWSTGSIYISADGDTVASVPMRVTTGEREANARLIAAAPELLDALRGMCGLIQLLNGGQRIDEPDVALSSHRYVDALALLERFDGGKAGE